MREICSRYEGMDDPALPGSDCCNVINDGLTNYQNCAWREPNLNSLLREVSQYCE